MSPLFSVVCTEKHFLVFCHINCVYPNCCWPIPDVKNVLWLGPLLGGVSPLSKCLCSTISFTFMNLSIFKNKFIITSCAPCTFKYKKKNFFRFSECFFYKKKPQTRDARLLQMAFSRSFLACKGSRMSSNCDFGLRLRLDAEVFLVWVVFLMMG